MKKQGRFRPRSRLARDITIVVAVKVLALIIIKLAWFSDPPTPVVSEALLGTVSADKR